MTSSQATAPPATRKRESRQAGLRSASLAILIVLIVQFALGIGVNLYVTLPAAGHHGHNQWFGNGGLVAILLAAFFGSGFTDKLTDGYSLGMAIAFAAALACYAIGLYTLTARRS